jgi:RNA ligase
MKCNFPVITSINDVLPHVIDRPEIVVANRGDHTIINYVVSSPDLFMWPEDPSISSEEAHRRAIIREARGLIFDKDGLIIRRPFHKFKNIGESEETLPRNIDLTQPHVIVEKLDGSMIAPFFVNGQMRFGTRMGVTDVADQARAFVEQHDNRLGYIGLIEDAADEGYTVIFEWMSRKQMIVIDHREDRLEVIAIRNIQTGEYLSYEQVAFTCASFVVPYVKKFDVSGATCAQSVSDYVASLVGVEGVVINIDGMMYKAKGNWYVGIHKARDSIREERHVIQYIVDEKVDDILPKLEQEDRDNLIVYQRKVLQSIADFTTAATNAVRMFHRSWTDRKAFALYSTNAEPFLRQATFHFWDRRDFDKVDMRAYVMDKLVRPGISSRTKLAELKNTVFPNIRFFY